ncbi:MAG TPA: hypothetical protein VF533_09975 [Solirubrobacteraceae bacterium]|jgi:hypothetical protein
MRVLTTILLSVVAALLLVSPAAAKPRYVVGIGDQSAAMFANPHFLKLGIKRVRYIVPWDGLKHAGQRAEIDTYMSFARGAGMDVMLAFSARRGCYKDGRYSKRKACRAPSYAAFRTQVRAFHRRFPEVRTYSPWNEANHKSQPTKQRPLLALRYYRVVRRVCMKCTVVALDLLDQGDMVRYLEAFAQKAGSRARIWGIHNYSDVNGFRNGATQKILAAAPGEVWMTETGGIVKFKPRYGYDERRAARSIRTMFALADKYSKRQPGTRSRITRVYPYQWTGVRRGERFDAGLTDPRGRPRKALQVFRRYVRQRGR